MTPSARRASPRLLRALAAGLLLSGCGHFEEVTSEGSLRGEAARNPLLAAERVLSGLGLPATSMARPPSPWPADSVLLVSGELFTIEDEVTQGFLDWIASGQHAIVFLDGFREDPPPGGGPDSPAGALLERLGVERIPDLSDEEEAQGEEDPEHAELFLDRSWESGYLRRNAGVYSRLRVPHGEGLVSLVPGGSPIAGKGLSELDHARWLWREVHAGPQAPQAVALVYGGRPTLWALIHEHAPGAPWALLLLIVLTLWRLASRFGPRLQETPPARLGFEQHVDAVGGYLWSHGGRESMVQAWRQRVARLAQRKLHLPIGADGDPSRAPGFPEALAKCTERPVEQVRRAMTSEHLDDPDNYTQIVADLQDLERAL